MCFMLRLCPLFIPDLHFCFLSYCMHGSVFPSWTRSCWLYYGCAYTVFGALLLHTAFGPGRQKTLLPLAGFRLVLLSYSILKAPA